MEEEWESFKEAVNKSAMEVCRKRRVGGRGIRKGSKWWNDRIKKVLREKRQLYERWLQSRKCIRIREERQKEWFSLRNGEETKGGGRSSE